ncbi:hypothetical protein BS47DRAFT_786649 [Hydnum rufescens UP504]|uniref:Transmembrane protein n=1 Tax=Hydnum rufescens UP504 TaxID=1448309 RepID=A0A9P6B0J0_9AGAM|nr:hypothetical protein BS47DRAFT_786649 [Hydnum rufescens UP504]
MFSSRIFSFFFLFITFGLFVCAKPVPVDTTDLAVRSNAELVRRGCGCSQDIIDVLTTLQVSVNAQVVLLDGVHSPSGPCNSILAAIHVCVTALASIVITVTITASEVVAIAQLLVAIILSIVNACGHYSLVIILTLILQLDSALAGLVHACAHLVVGLVAQLTIKLGGSVSLLTSLHFFLTLAACGL